MWWWFITFPKKQKFSDISQKSKRSYHAHLEAKKAAKEKETEQKAKNIPDTQDWNRKACELQWIESELKTRQGKGSSIKYVRKIFWKSNISYPQIRTQRVRNVSFLENFAYVLNVWPLTWKQPRPTYQKEIWNFSMHYLKKYHPREETQSAQSLTEEGLERKGSL